jgi:hypothetical protein
MHEGKPSEPASYAKQFGVEAPSWPLDVSAVQYAPMNQLRGPNSFGEEKAMKSILSGSRYSGHHRCDSCMRYKLGRTEQEGDCRVNCGRSTVVYATLLQ